MAHMHDMGSSDSVAMVFTLAHDTPLYSSRWTPTTSGAYAGTCIFLAVLAIIDRLIAMWRRDLEVRWQDKALNRRYVVLAGETDERQLDEDKSEEATLTADGHDERVKVIRSPRRLDVTPWRISVDLPRACVYTLWAGNSYLLMLAVMTLNVGYFLSVLAGLFIGELALGRFIARESQHH